MCMRTPKWDAQPTLKRACEHQNEICVRTTKWDARTHSQVICACVSRFIAEPSAPSSLSIPLFWQRASEPTSLALPPTLPPWRINLIVTKMIILLRSSGYETASLCIKMFLKMLTEKFYDLAWWYQTVKQTAMYQERQDRTGLNESFAQL